MMELLWMAGGCDDDVVLSVSHHRDRHKTFSDILCLSRLLSSAGHWLNDSR